MDIWQYGALKSYLFKPRVEAIARKPVSASRLTILSIYRRTAVGFGDALIWVGSQIKQRNQLLTDRTSAPGTRLKTITIE